MDSPPVFSPNPYANFDPSQWSNPYSSFQNKGIPFPASYMGWPTDAMGNPIAATSATPGLTPGQTSAAAAPASTPGTTLNSSPTGGGSPWMGNSSAYRPPTQAGGQYTVNPAAFSALGGSVDPSTGQTIYQANRALQGYYTPAGSPGAMAGLSPADMSGLNQAITGGGQQAAAPTPAASPSGGLTAQQYLSLLAHPNPVTTPGATVPQSAQSYQPQGGGLAQFLAGWNPAQSGPGSGFQQGFNRALRSS